MFTYKSLVCGALILGIIVVIADNKPMDLCYIWYNIFFHIFPNAYNTKNLINVLIEYKNSNPIIIQVSLTYSVYHCVCFWRHFWPKDYNLNKLGRGLLGDAKYQISIV